MGDAPREYRSIEEIRADLYPNSSSMLDIGREEVLEFPATLADESLRVVERIANRATRKTTSNKSDDAPNAKGPSPAS